MSVEIRGTGTFVPICAFGLCYGPEKFLNVQWNVNYSQEIPTPAASKVPVVSTHLRLRKILKVYQLPKPVEQEKWQSFE